MILKRLKLFTAGLPGTPGYTFSDYNSIMNNNNNSNSANTNAGNGNTTNAAANTGNASTNAPADPKPGSNANTGNAASVNNAGGSGAGNASAAANAGANAANSGSVMQKQTYNKPGVSTNNVKADTAQAYNKEQLDNLNKAHQQEVKNAIAQSSKRGEQAGMKKAGVWQGLKNTWRNAGTMKKIGMGGAALAGTYFLGKGLLGGNNNNDQ
jgi:hypothetical protein